MIEAVSTSSVLNTALRQTSQSGASASLPPIAEAPKYGGSRIVVNNLQNVAVLQDLDADGKVTAQYPTQSQIQAFRQAEALAAHAQELAQLTSAPSQGSTASASSSSSSSSSSSQDSTLSASDNSSASVAPSTANILEAMTTASVAPASSSSAPASNSQSSTSVVV